MDAEDFRKLALDLPEATEGAHQGHPDFRIREKIFASLAPDGDWGMVKLAPPRQAAWVREEPDVFEPFAGAWGRAGCTRVHLPRARKTTVHKALREAWTNVAPPSIAEKYGPRRK